MLNICVLPERLLLQCPSLRNVHASDCEELLVGAIRSQVHKLATSLYSPIAFEDWLSGRVGTIRVHGRWLKDGLEF